MPPPFSLGCLTVPLLRGPYLSKLKRTGLECGFPGQILSNPLLCLSLKRFRKILGSGLAIIHFLPDPGIVYRTQAEEKRRRSGVAPAFFPRLSHRTPLERPLPFKTQKNWLGMRFPRSNFKQPPFFAFPLRGSGTSRAKLLEVFLSLQAEWKRSRSGVLSQKSNYRCVKGKGWDKFLSSLFFPVLLSLPYPLY